MKYISFLPGGFEECHRFIENQNYQIMQIRAQNNKHREAYENEASVEFLHFLEPHDSSNCYHCYQASLPYQPASSSLLQSSTTMDSSRTVQIGQTQNQPVGYHQSNLEAQDESQGTNGVSVGTDNSLSGAGNNRNSQRYRGAGEFN